MPFTPDKTPEEKARDVARENWGSLLLGSLGFLGEQDQSMRFGPDGIEAADAGYEVRRAIMAENGVYDPAVARLAYISYLQAQRGGEGSENRLSRSISERDMAHRAYAILMGDYKRLTLGDVQDVTGYDLKLQGDQSGQYVGDNKEAAALMQRHLDRTHLGFGLEVLAGQAAGALAQKLNPPKEEGNSKSKKKKK